MYNGPPPPRKHELHGGPHDGSSVELPSDIDYVLLADSAVYTKQAGVYRFGGYDATARAARKRSVLRPKPKTQVEVAWNARQFGIFMVVFLLASWKLGELLVLWR